MRSTICVISKSSVSVSYEMSRSADRLKTGKTSEKHVFPSLPRSFLLKFNILNVSGLNKNHVITMGNVMTGSRNGFKRNRSWSVQSWLDQFEKFSFFHQISFNSFINSPVKSRSILGSHKNYIVWIKPEILINQFYFFLDKKHTRRWFWWSYCLISSGRAFNY